MKKENIIKEAQERRQNFEGSNRNEPYQLRGIFASEALLIVTVAEALGAKRIVESGRARGYSTKLLANFFQNRAEVEIVSIDFDKNSSDAKYSEESLKGYPNVHLVYGNAIQILPEFISENTLVFIDGPKGDEALLLAAKALRDRRVKAVCIHDLHKNTFHRDICEILFKETFFSDDADFVKEFEALDAKCWEKLESHGEAPYVRKGNKINSYASTVAIVFNGEKPINERVLENYSRYYREHSSLSFKKYVRERLAKHPEKAEPIFKLYRKIKKLLR